MNTGRPEAGEYYADLYNRAMNELAALREELNEKGWDEMMTRLEDQNESLRQRFAAAERRNSALTEAMERIHFRCETFNDEALGMKKHSVRVMLDISAKALTNSTESGSSE